MYHHYYIVFDGLFKANFWAQRNGGTIKKHRGEGPFVMIDKALESGGLVGTEWPDAEAFWKDAKAEFPIQREEEKAVVAKIQEARRAKEH